MRKKSKKKKKNHVAYIPKPKIECDLVDFIDEFKEKVKLGTGLYLHLYSSSKDDGTYCGYVVGIYEHFVLCKSASGNYNFTVSWKDLALGTAEVI